MEASVLKSFPQFTREYIRDGISYVNLCLLQLSIPPYRGLDEKGVKGKGEKEKKNRLDEFKHANEVFEAF